MDDNVSIGGVFNNLPKIDRYIGSPTKKRPFEEKKYLFFMKEEEFDKYIFGKTPKEKEIILEDDPDRMALIEED